MSEAPARRIYLHVGQHKTGTTWIQNVMDHNRARLAERGICYPELGACHGWPLTLLFARRDDIDRLGPKIGQRRIHSRPAQMKRNREILDAALDDPRWRKVVISGEQLCDMLRWNEIRALSEALHRDGVGVTVIFYAREPLGYAASMTQQRLKAGVTLRELREEPPTPDYKRRLQKFFRFFGRDNVEIRVYDRQRLKDGDVLADFLDAIGEPELAGALDTPASLASNSSMSALAARILDLRNRTLRRLSPSLARRHPPSGTRLLTGLPGRRFTLSAQVRRDVSASSRADVAWLERKLGFDPFPSARREGAGAGPGRKTRGAKSQGGKAQGGKAQGGKAHGGKTQGGKAQGQKVRTAQARGEVSVKAPGRRGGKAGGARRSAQEVAT